ncbi:MAG TPA: non-homologous end-joining DNA ligase [Casimicrobiaceae bacterium]|nr:non-homologous end-joining DNA ligase [Casimicrobiaceae bacterium]
MSGEPARRSIAARKRAVKTRVAPASEPASRTHHPSVASSPRKRARGAPPALAIPGGVADAQVTLGERSVRLTNLTKVFWPEPGYTKRDLLQYYVDVAPALLPHLADRAMVMKRYPNGAAGEFFFMKRAPEPRPAWIETCAIAHASGSVIDFPIVQDLASLLWLVNLGCIDLNPWYARCDDVDRPDFLHFDLDPVPGATFEQVRDTAILVRDGLRKLGMSPLAKTTGSKGIHVYVAIERGPTQKAVWGFAKRFAFALAGLHPHLVTAEYRIAKRPADRVLVDYNQNAWGRTLASVYSPRPRPLATVSTPITWEELEAGAVIDDFRLDNVPRRVQAQGDLWAPLLAPKGRFGLEPLL